MPKLPPIKIQISERYGYTETQLESLKSAFNVKLASINRARKGESDSPVGETNVSRQPSAKKGTKRAAKSSGRKK